MDRLFVNPKHCNIEWNNTEKESQNSSLKTTYDEIKMFLNYETYVTFSIECLIFLSDENILLPSQMFEWLSTVFLRY